MKSKVIPTTVFCLCLLISSVYADDDALLTPSDIIDSTALLSKIQSPDDPLYSFFNKGKAADTRADVVDVINENVIPNTQFAFIATKLDEAKSEDVFKKLTPEQKETLCIKNRTLLTELYPDEIAPFKKVMRQGFGMKIDLLQPDTAMWLKAEVINCINEILFSDVLLSDWRNIRYFFDASVDEEEIQSLAAALLPYAKKRVPINMVSVDYSKKNMKADVLIKENEKGTPMELFQISVVPGKKWKITAAKKFEKNLLKAGYLEEKEALNE